MPASLIAALLLALAAPTPPTPADAATRARERAIAAYRQLKAGDADGAIAGFKASSALAWRRSNDCNIGTAYLVDGRLHRAWFFLDRCRRRWAEGDPPGEAPRPLPLAIDAHLERLTASLAEGHRMVEIVSEPAGATVVLDAFAEDEPITTPVVLYLPDGPVEARARLPGRTPKTQRFVVGAAEPSTVTLDLALDPATATRRLMGIRRTAHHEPERARAQWETLLQTNPTAAAAAEDRLFAANLLVRSGRRNAAIGELLGLAADDGRWSERDRAAFMLRVAELHLEDGRRKDALIDIEVAEMLIADTATPVLRDAVLRLRARLDGAARAAVRFECAGTGARARLQGRDDDRRCGGAWQDVDPATVRGEVDFGEGRTVPFEAQVAAGGAARVRAAPGADVPAGVWALGGGALVVGGVAAWRYAVAAQAWRDMENPPDRASWLRLRAHGEAARQQSEVALGAALALAGGAVAWWLLYDDAPRVTVSVQPTAGAIEWRGRF